MAAAKLHINLVQGLIEAEGEEAFVLKVYEDFKERIKAHPQKPQPPADEEAEADEQVNKGAGGRRRTGNRKATNQKGDGDETPGITSYKPKRDTSLDLSGLKAFMGDYAPKNNADRYVLYTHYLKDTLAKEPCTVDQIYSCMLHMKDKLPKAFGQNFVDVKNANGFITFSGPNDITLTTTGLNHFNFDVPRKGAKA